MYTIHMENQAMCVQAYAIVSEQNRFREAKNKITERDRQTDRKRQRERTKRYQIMLLQKNSMP